MPEKPILSARDIRIHMCQWFAEKGNIPAIGDNQAILCDSPRDGIHALNQRKAYALSFGTVFEIYCKCGATGWQFVQMFVNESGRILEGEQLAIAQELNPHS